MDEEEVGESPVMEAPPMIIPKQELIDPRESSHVLKEVNLKYKMIKNVNVPKFLGRKFVKNLN